MAAVSRKKSNPTYKEFFGSPDMNKHRIFYEQTKKNCEHEPTTKIENYSIPMDQQQVEYHISKKIKLN